jgi:hypothetical protein
VSIEEADMADTGTAKSRSGNLDEKEQQREERRTSDPIEKQELNNVEVELDAEEKQAEEGRQTRERIEKQDLNQGMDTGTHDSTRRGIHWGPAYQVRSTTSRKSQKMGEPNKTSKEKGKKSTH